MPKGKKKGKYEHRRTEVQYSSDEDAVIDTNMDNCSEISGQSDLKSNHDDAGMDTGPERCGPITNEMSERILDRAIQLAEEVVPSACMGTKESVRQQAKAVTAPLQPVKTSAPTQIVHKGYSDPAQRQRSAGVWPYAAAAYATNVNDLQCTPALCRIRKYKCQDCRLQRYLRSKKEQLGEGCMDGDENGMETGPERCGPITNEMSERILDRAIQLAEEIVPSACMGTKESVRQQAKAVTAPLQPVKTSAPTQIVHKGYSDPAQRQRSAGVWPYAAAAYATNVNDLQCTPTLCRIRKYKCQDCFNLQRYLRSKKGQLGEGCTDGDENENEIQEKQEEKVLEIIEALSARSNAARATAFVALRAALQRRAFDTVLCSHRATLADHISRALRRGKDGERKAAAAVTPLVALQIGEEGTEGFVAEVRPALTATVTDKSASLETRTECCSSLAVLCYLMEEDVTEILEVMRVYESVFSGSYLKGDGTVKVSGAAIEEGALHAAALDAWALLQALLAPAHALQQLRSAAPGLARLGELLAAPALDVRVAAGGALAAACESACAGAPADHDELAPHVAALLPRLEELARDSHKYRAKRDRKVQRATFRDILKYFEEGAVPTASARVGCETAAWSSWRGAAAYGALAAALGGALQPLAARSALLRAALALPDHAPDGRPTQKLNKLQRHLQNNAACKARTLARNKNRDKRSAALAI